MNFVKFTRTRFLTKHLRWLLLYVDKDETEFNQLTGNHLKDVLKVNASPEPPEIGTSHKKDLILSLTKSSKLLNSLKTKNEQK